jgi:hypothetical protein
MGCTRLGNVVGYADDSGGRYVVYIGISGVVVVGNV